MEIRDQDENLNRDDRIPITEWPVCSSSGEQSKNQTSNELGNPSFPKLQEPCFQFNKKWPTANFITLSGEQQLVPSLKRKQQSTFQSLPTKYLRKSDEINEGNEEPMAAVRVAKWWRKKQHLHSNFSVTSENPNTRLHHISRIKECQEFLRDERRLLKRRLSDCSRIDKASAYAALASLEDWLDSHDAALENITIAVDLCPTNSEFLWLKAKLSRHHKALQIQKEMTEKCNQYLKAFPPVKKVDRISCKNLSVQDFKEHFVKRGIPVILEDVVSSMAEENWDLDHIKEKAGCITVSVKRNIPGSVEWAKLEESSRMTVGEHVDRVKEGRTADYLFDWSLPLHCPQLANEITIPEYFSDNFLSQTNPGSLYRDSWPSLFVAPAGIASELHVDAFASSFWMALFHGEKRWTFFDASDLALLYPKYIHSLDPVFSANIAEPDLKSFPLLALTKPKQCVLKPGDLLFVPAGSPHFVENLTASVAVSSNYVDATNYHQVCEELRISGLIDPRAKELMDQFESSDFKARTMANKT